MTYLAVQSAAAVVTGEELRRRMRAARVLAGFRSTEKLAAAIDEPGLGGRTLRNMEQGKRVGARRDLRTVAEACGLPLAWFEVEDLGAAVAAGATSLGGGGLRAPEMDDEGEEDDEAASG
jgi:hypothetical protein